MMICFYVCQKISVVRMQGKIRAARHCECCIYFWTVKYIFFWFWLIDLNSLSLAASFSLNSHHVSCVKEYHISTHQDLGWWWARKESYPGIVIFVKYFILTLSLLQIMPGIKLLSEMKWKKFLTKKISGTTYLKTKHKETYSHDKKYKESQIVKKCL